MKLLFCFFALFPFLGMAQTNAPAAPPSNDGKYVPDIAREAAAEGNAAFKNKDLVRAARAYKKVLDLAPDNLVALINLGVVAMAALAQATLYDPRNARARNYLGVVVGRKGWIDGAQAELTKAVELDPSYTDAHYNLAAFYLEKKPPSIELARRHYYRAVELGAEKDPDIEKILNAAPAPSGKE